VREDISDDYSIGNASIKMTDSKGEPAIQSLIREGFFETLRL
jgi:hypothetical protein